MPPGMSPEEYQGLFAKFLSYRGSRREGRREGKHRVLVREPTVENSTLLYERFGGLQEAMDFVREVAPTYPEGTLIFITGAVGSGSYVRRAFIVSKYGEATPRKRGRWVPDRALPLEWVGEVPEVGSPLGREMGEVELEGLSQKERGSLRALLWETLIPEEKDEEEESRRVEGIRRRGYLYQGEEEMDERRSVGGWE